MPDFLGNSRLSSVQSSFALSWHFPFQTAGHSEAEKAVEGWQQVTVSQRRQLKLHGSVSLFLITGQQRLRSVRSWSVRAPSWWRSSPATWIPSAWGPGSSTEMPPSGGSVAEPTTAETQPGATVSVESSYPASPCKCHPFPSTGFWFAFPTAPSAHQPSANDLGIPIIWSSVLALGWDNFRVIKRGLRYHLFWKVFFIVIHALLSFSYLSGVWTSIVSIDRVNSNDRVFCSVYLTNGMWMRLCFVNIEINQQFSLSSLEWL